MSPKFPKYGLVLAGLSLLLGVSGFRKSRPRLAMEYHRQKLRKLTQTPLAHLKITRVINWPGMMNLTAGLLIRVPGRFRMETAVPATAAGETVNWSTTTNRSQNLNIQDGNLVIEAVKEDFNGHGYTSSKIVTAGKRMFKFAALIYELSCP